MASIAFTLDKAYLANGVKLAALGHVPISEAMWQAMADHIAQETAGGLRPTPANVVAGRWQQGNAAAVIYDGCIIAYASLVPILCSTNQHKFTQALGTALDLNQLPAVNVYKLATVWTLPIWRRKGIHLQLIPALLKQGNSTREYLHTAVAVGLAGSPMMAALGWQIVGWNELPYASSLIGFPVKGFEALVELPWWPPAGMQPYNGPHIDPRQNTSHNWGRFCHLWMANVPRAIELDRQLAQLMKGDLRRWREVCIAVFTGRRESPLNFFRE
jgi:hypothetical protein